MSCVPMIQCVSVVSGQGDRLGREEEGGLAFVLVMGQEMVPSGGNKLDPDPDKRLCLSGPI